MEILSITYARVLYLVPFKILKLYKILHSRCMLRQFETRSSDRPEGHMRRFLYKNIKFHIEKQSFYTVMQSEGHMHRYNFVVQFY